MRARLVFELRTRDGDVIARREASNIVLQSGGQLVADLFSGKGGAISHMAVGTSDAEPDSVAVTALGNDDGTGAPGLSGPTSTPLAAEAFRTEVDELHRRVVVRIRATLPGDAAVGTIREAALVSRRDATDVLYNRVIFPPVDKGNDHDLALFWEVEFPFGDLQWLVR
jgi:CO/xanthine dehydrogenase Mo-binding subunit